MRKLRLQFRDQTEVSTPREDNNAIQSTNSRSRSRGRVYTARARSSSAQRGATYVRTPPTPPCLSGDVDRYYILLRLGRAVHGEQLVRKMIFLFNFSGKQNSNPPITIKNLTTTSCRKCSCSKQQEHYLSISEKNNYLVVGTAEPIRHVGNH